jgi:hypothetical protein
MIPLGALVTRPVNCMSPPMMLIEPAFCTLLRTRPEPPSCPVLVSNPPLICDTGLSNRISPALASEALEKLPL